MKNILGLDLGTNSIGWAVVSTNEENKPQSIKGLGSRIIPMSADILGDFEKGNSISQTKERTRLRGIRRLRERSLLNRERLFRVLHILNFLPEHFDKQIGFDKRNYKTYGKFINDKEPKLTWKQNEDNSYEFIFKNSFNEMVNEFKEKHPDLFENEKRIPYDWTLYYLRKKALTQKISKEELAWILLNFNQKRGYNQLRGENAEDDKIIEEIKTATIKDVVRLEVDKKNPKRTWYEVSFENISDIKYKASFYNDITHWIGTQRDFVLKYKSSEDKNPTIQSLPTIEEIDAMDAEAKNRMYDKIKKKQK